MGRRQGRGDLLQGLVDDAEVGPFAALFAADEPCVYELLHVVRDGGLGEGQRFGEVADARFGALGSGDHRQQAHPRRVGQSLEDVREPLGGSGFKTAAGQR